MAIFLVGSQSVAATSAAEADTHGLLFKFTAAQSGALTALGCAIAVEVGANYKLAIYDASGSTKLGETASFAGVAGTNVHSLIGSAVTIVAGTDYWIESLCDGNYQWLYCDGSTSNTSFDSNSTWPSFSSTATVTSTDNIGMPSLWGEGTVGGVSATGSGATITESGPTGSAGILTASVSDQLIGLNGSLLPNLTGLTALVYKTVPASKVAPDKFISGVSTDSLGHLVGIDLSDLGQTSGDVILILMKNGTPFKGGVRKVTPTYVIT